MTYRQTYFLEYNLIIHHLRENKKRQERIITNMIEAEKKRRFAIEQHKLIIEENKGLEYRLQKLNIRYGKIPQMKVRFGKVEERIYYVDKKMRKYHSKERKEKKSRKRSRNNNCK